MTTSSLAALGLRIKALRVAKGLTQAELAERCGYEPLTISRFERGTYAPGIDTLEAIAQVLGVSFQDFFSKTSTEQLASDRIRHQITDTIYSIDDPNVLIDVLKYIKRRSIKVTVP